MWVDGVVEDTENFPYEMGNNDLPFSIGNRDIGCGGDLTDAAIDEVNLYNRAISEQEISDLANVNNDEPACQPPAPQIKLKIQYPNPIAAGRTTQVTLTLPDVAPAGDATIDLSTVGEAGAITIPTTVTVPEGSDHVDFTIDTAITDLHKSVDIVASYQTITGRATASIYPAVADLTVLNLAAPANADVGQNISLSWTVQNVGQAIANSEYWLDTVYISPDDNYSDNNNTVLTYGYHYAPLAVNGTENITVNNIQIPGSAIPADGDYYIFVFTNSNFAVNEREQYYVNNFVSRPIHVLRHLPEYQAETIILPTTVEPGVDFNFGWTTRNVGTAPGGSTSYDRMYFSVDDVRGNDDDVLMAVGTIPALAVGDAHTTFYSMHFPTLPERPSSDSFFYLEVDYFGQIYEGTPTQIGETNNHIAQPVRFEYRVPDLQVQSITPPFEAETDTPYPLQWTTQNTGNRAAGAFYERIYFSKDMVIGGDTEIGWFWLDQGVAANSSVDRIQNVTIPTGAITETGDYYVYVKTDSDGNIDEGANENNNIRFQPIHVRRFLRPDLQVTNITAPATAFFDQNIQVQWTVTNNGPGATNSNQWYDSVYLSTTTNPGGASIYATNINYLNVGESYIATANFHIPRGSSGSYYVVVKTDNNNQVNEESEANNVSSSPITIATPPVPDLRVSNVQAPPFAFAGQPIAVSWTVTNSGTGSTLPGENTSYDGIYLSRDTVLDGSDRFIGYRTHNGAIPQNGSYTANGFSVDMPVDAMGAYYVFVVADYSNQVYEFTSESNNSDYDRITDGSPMNTSAAPPDLVILNPFTAPATGNAGSGIAVSFTVKNNGAFNAAGNDGWYEGLYLSTDTTLSANDQLIGYSARHDFLAAGGQYAVSFGATLPSCLDGTYYLIAKTDLNNQIFEYDPIINAEGNNESEARQIQITNNAIDLQVTSVQTPPVGNAGQAINVQWTVKNFGGATNQSYWTDRVLIFAETGQPPINLGTFVHSGALAPNATYTQNQVVTLPGYLQGNYQMYVQTDADGYVPECSLEGNNYTASPLFNVPNSLPDLRVSAIAPQASAVLGTTITVDYTGVNNAAAMTPATWSDGAYLSTNNIWDGNDKPIGASLRTAPVGAGETYAGQITANIPNLLPGNYFLIVYADASGTVTEGSPLSPMENNNWFAVPITLTVPGIDLQATNVSVPTPVYSGLQSNISWTVTNTGTVETLVSEWTDYVILSRDAAYDQTDNLLCYKQHVGALAGGASYSETMPCNIPAGLTGDYNIFVVTDRNNVVIEADNANNISAPFQVNLQFPLPSDLNITNITVPGSAAPGEDATFTWTVQNSGTNASMGTWLDTVYLSTDTTWDVGDAIVTQQPHTGPVGISETYTTTITTPVPPVETGTYYVIVRTDARNNVRESNEINNLTTSVMSVNVAVQELALGVPFNTTLTTNRERFYKYNTPADETLLVTLLGQAGSSNELYTKYGAMVNRANYEVQGNRQGEADQENVVANTTAGTYYSMIRGDYVPGSFAGQLKQPAKASEKPSSPTAESVIVKAEILPFSVRKVEPAEAGNQGYTIVSLEGAKFQTGATIKLVGPTGVESAPIYNYFYSQAKIAALFDLNGKAAGNYQVVATNPNAQTAAWSGNFHIKNGGGGPQTRAEIIGPSAIGPNSRNRFVVSVANDGGNDAISVPVVILLSGPYEYHLSTSNYLPSADPADDPLPTNAFHADRDGIRVIALFVPVIRGNSKVDIGIDVTFPFGGTITANAFNPLFNTGMYPDAPGLALAPTAGGQQVVNCWTHLVLKTILTILGEIFPEECALEIALSITGLAEDALGYIRTGSFDGYEAFSSFMTKIAKSSAHCLKDALRYLPWLKVASILYDVYQIAKQGIECIILTIDYVKTTYVPQSFDPNEIIGPAGFGPEKFVGIQKPLLYRINFENLSTATAPAQQIRVLDQLPPGFDIRTVRLVEIGFKQTRIEVPPNQAFYQGRVQLGADLDNLKADIFAGVDITNGRVIWSLTAIDPATNEQPISPLLGLLPPNNAEHDGEGYVTFLIQPESDKPTRTALDDKATIFFDQNEPIDTNTTSNLLDADIPTSQMTALDSTQSSASFNLNWSGSDLSNGAGLKSFDIFVSENGGAYTRRISDTPLSSTLFAGKWGKSYRFYSIAEDNAENREPIPDDPDATTTVLGGAFEGDVSPRPNGNNNGTVDGDDTAQLRRFIAKLDTVMQYNEFQRADTAPLAVGGDGILSVADIVQARRFELSLDTTAEAAGPNAAGSLVEKAKSSDIAKTGKAIGKAKKAGEANLSPRSVEPVFISRTGNKVKLGLVMEAQGDEAGVGLTLNFNTAHLSNPANITLGSVATGADLTANTSEAPSGRVGIVLDKAPDQPFAAGPMMLVTIEFDVAPGAPASTDITFGDTPVVDEVVSGLADVLSTSFTDASVPLLGPTAAGVRIGGHIESASGQPIRNVRISVTDTSGSARYALTNAFGYFEVDGLEAGNTYVVALKHKTFAFTSRVVTVKSDITDLDFTPDP
ncbi:MAG TPA: CARDB domain-containing protein [Pyrinomonadaceae bacterium]|nr:CARDB domain-containing protein [Pyrinomonadaceae bacterium]